MTFEQFETWNVVLLLAGFTMFWLPIVAMGAIEMTFTALDWWQS